MNLCINTQDKWEGGGAFPLFVFFTAKRLKRLTALVRNHSVALWGTVSWVSPTPTKGSAFGNCKGQRPLTHVGNDEKRRGYETFYAPFYRGKKRKGF